MNLPSKIPVWNRFLKRVKPWFSHFRKLSRWYHLGKLFGVPIHIHTSTILLIFLFFFLRGPWSLAAFSIGLLIHEYAHVWMLRSFNIETEKIQITGVGAAAIQGPNAFEKLFNHGDIEIKVAAAGPLMSALLASIGYIGAIIALLSGAPNVSEVFAEFAFINTLLGCFNMLPIFPLDGGRVLRGFLHQHYFQHLKDKELLNRKLMRWPRIIKWFAFGTLGGFPTLGIVLFITAHSLESETKNTQRYIDHIKAQYSYKPDRTPFQNILWWLDLGLRERPYYFKDVKKAYRAKISQVHPDKGGSDQQMQKVLHAYHLAKKSFGV